LETPKCFSELESLAILKKFAMILLTDSLDTFRVPSEESLGEKSLKEGECRGIKSNAMPCNPNLNLIVSF
jgi:hypothetical protein